MPRPHHPSPIRRGVVRLGIALTGLLLSVSALSAQSVTSIFVRPGERVRVTTREHTPMGATRVGVLHEARRDSVTVDFTSGGRETLPLDRLARLEVSDGRGSYAARGMGYGALTGALAGAAIGLARADGGDEYFPPAAVAAVTGVVGALAGAVAGGVLGAMGRRERWTPVLLEQPLRRVTVMPD